MSTITAFSGARIFDGQDWHEGKSLVVADGRVLALADKGEIPLAARRVDADGAAIVPGFIDLQVNGGGGTQFNDVPTPDGIARIIHAHARYGTTRLLPTLITDNRKVTTEAMIAGVEAAARNMPGFLGIHLEGPHLSRSRKGAHDPQLIRPMESEDLTAILHYREQSGLLLTTLAPESVSVMQTRVLAEHGVIVSLGHSDVTCDEALTYFAAGARMVTHLFNAMSPLSHREPGLVGAALHSRPTFAGMIADGFHVDPVSMGVALRAKYGPGRIFLVTDAMSTIGTDDKGLVLNGRQIFRDGGRLTLADGTLAGADIDMLSSVKFVHETLGYSIEEALRMASLYPAEAAGIAALHGRLLPGFVADFILLNSELDIQSVWIDGVELD